MEYESLCLVSLENFIKVLQGFLVLLGASCQRKTGLFPRIRFFQRKYEGNSGLFEPYHCQLANEIYVGSLALAYLFVPFSYLVSNICLKTIMF